MIDLSLIENLYLTKNLEKDGENKISIDKLTQTFKLLASERVESCEFMHYQRH
jgi:benzoyl-CoA reductase/2-hydroxyglutaryl-CoA dehydratase subunit BcrC/BadD/HgdB